MLISNNFTYDLVPGCQAHNVLASLLDSDKLISGTEARSNNDRPGLPTNAARMSIPAMLNYTNGQFKHARNADGLTIINLLIAFLHGKTDDNREKPLHALR